MSSFDPPGFIRTIRSLFRAEGVHLRELVQNSLESLNQVRPQVSDRLRVEVTCDLQHATISVTDNGIGMSREDLTEKLLRLFFSGWPTTEGSTLGIGQFGFGFYSAFLVAQRVVVISRPRKTPGQAYRLIVDDDMRQIDIQPEVALPEIGTSVRLHLRPDARHFADEDLIRSELLNTYLHAAFPIMLNGRPSGILNSQDWVRSLSVPGSASLIGERLQAKHGWNERPLSVHGIDFGNGGWLAVAPKIGPQVPPIDVYRRGIFVTSQELIPEPLNMVVCGIIDAPDLTLKGDRECLVDDAALYNLRTALGHGAVAVLAAMAKREPAALDDLLEENREIFTIALLTNTSLRETIGNRYAFRLFETGARSNLIRLGDSAEEGRVRRVLIIRNVSAERTFADRAVQVGERVVIVGNAAEEELLRLLSAEHGITCKPLITAYIEDIQQSPVHNASLVHLFKEVCETDWHVLCCHDADLRLPVRVVQLVGTDAGLPLEPPGDDPILNALFRHFLDVARKDETIVIINANHPLVISLNDNNSGNHESRVRIADILVFLGRLTCGYPTDTASLSRFNAELLQLIQATPRNTRASAWSKLRKLFLKEF